MSYNGTARTDGATRYGDAADYSGATSVDRDYRRTAGYDGASGAGGASGAPVVSFVNVSKHYGSLKAVDGLSLDLRPG